MADNRYGRRRQSCHLRQRKQRSHAHTKKCKIPESAISKYKKQMEHNQDNLSGYDSKKEANSILQSRQQMEPSRKRRRDNGIRNSQRRTGD